MKQIKTLSLTNWSEHGEIDNSLVWGQPQQKEPPSIRKRVSPCACAYDRRRCECLSNSSSEHSSSDSISMASFTSDTSGTSTSSDHPCTTTYRNTTTLNNMRGSMRSSTRTSLPSQISSRTLPSQHKSGSGSLDQSRSQRTMTFLGKDFLAEVVREQPPADNHAYTKRAKRRFNKQKGRRFSTDHKRSLFDSFEFLDLDELSYQSDEDDGIEFHEDEEEDDMVAAFLVACVDYFWIEGDDPDPDEEEKEDEEEVVFEADFEEEEEASNDATTTGMLDFFMNYFKHFTRPYKPVDDDAKQVHEKEEDACDTQKRVVGFVATCMQSLTQQVKWLAGICWIRVNDDCDDDPREREKEEEIHFYKDLTCGDMLTW